MRILMNDATRRAGLLLAAALLAGVPAAHGQDKKEEPKHGLPVIPLEVSFDERKVEGKSTLEEMLAEALKNNPDIRVAEAKLHEADAELNRARLTTMQKVVTFHADWQAARAKVAFEEKRLKRMRELSDKKAVEVRIVDESEASLAAAKVALAAVEAQMPSLIGKPPHAAIQLHFEQPAISSSRLQDDLSEEKRRRVALSALIAAARRQDALSQGAPSSIAYKLRVALETPLRVDFQETPFADVVEYLQDKSGIAIRSQMSRYKEGNPKITIQFKEPLPLRAVLQAIEDELPPVSGVGEMRFVVREYGLLVAPTSSLPREAILLDYLGHVGATTPAATTSGKNPPPREVEGTVKTIDDKTSLVSVSVGSDDGLQRGHTLEVYRVNPAKYVGTLHIVEVRAREAVGRMVNKQASVQPGDRVVSKIVGN